MLRSSGIKNNELKRFKEMTEIASKQTLHATLPNFSFENLNTTLRVEDRQEKILALLKED